jgi:hypothetical protein
VVAAYRHAHACAAAAARRARCRGPGPPRKALRERLRAFNTQAVRKNYKVSTRPPATLPLSPRLLKCVFPFPALNAQLTSSGILVTVFRVCGNGDNGVCYVSQHEDISTRASRFSVAYQAPHAVAAEASHAVTADGTHAVAGDGSHLVAGDGSHAVAADRRAFLCRI